MFDPHCAPFDATRFGELADALESREPDVVQFARQQAVDIVSTFDSEALAFLFGMMHELYASRESVREAMNRMLTDTAAAFDRIIEDHQKEIDSADWWKKS
jgi:hypothetical protein